jgi:hypothetical protein
MVVSLAPQKENESSTPQVFWFLKGRVLGGLSVGTIPEPLSGMTQPKPKEACEIRCHLLEGCFAEACLHSLYPLHAPPVIRHGCITSATLCRGGGVWGFACPAKVLRRSDGPRRWLRLHQGALCRPWSRHGSLDSSELGLPLRRRGTGAVGALPRSPHGGVVMPGRAPLGCVWVGQRPKTPTKTGVLRLESCEKPEKLLIVNVGLRRIFFQGAKP